MRIARYAPRPRRVRASALPLLFCAPCTLAAQAPAVLPDTRAWTLPPVYETTLPNGLTVVALEDGRVPMVTMRLVFPGGSRRDPKDLPGVASATADLLLQGTANQAASEFGDSVADAGRLNECRGGCGPDIPGGQRNRGEPGGASWDWLRRRRVRQASLSWKW